MGSEHEISGSVSKAKSRPGRRASCAPSQESARCAASPGRGRFASPELLTSGDRYRLDSRQIPPVLDVRGEPELQALEAGRLAGNGERADGDHEPVVGPQEEPRHSPLECVSVPLRDEPDFGCVRGDQGKVDAAAVPRQTPYFAGPVGVQHSRHELAGARTADEAPTAEPASRSAITDSGSPDAAATTRTASETAGRSGPSTSSSFAASRSRACAIAGLTAGPSRAARSSAFASRRGAAGAQAATFGLRAPLEDDDRAPVLEHEGIDRRPRRGGHRGPRSGRVEASTITLPPQLETGATQGREVRMRLPAGPERWRSGRGAHWSACRTCPFPSLSLLTGIANGFVTCL